MSLVNHLEAGTSLLLAQFSAAKKLQELLAAFLTQLQEVDNSFELFNDGKYIDNAEAERLDILGKLVGQERGLMADQEYRLWINARILLNHCQSKPEELYRILKLILGEDVPIKIIEHPEPAFTVEIFTALREKMRPIFELIQAAKPVGVRAFLHHAVQEPIFKFDNHAHKKGFFSTMIC